MSLIVGQATSMSIKLILPREADALSVTHVTVYIAVHQGNAGLFSAYAELC